MKKFIPMTFILISSFAISIPCLAKPWPILNDMTITSCGNSTCTKNVIYATTGTVTFVDAPPRPDDPSIGSKIIYPFEIHCDRGGQGVPFSVCDWNYNGYHSPDLKGKCETVTGSSWEVTPDSLCTVSTHAGGHSGAAPGAECVVFGKRVAGGLIATPWGNLSAETVANSRAEYCVKPIPPTVQCSINIPNDGTVDHGIVTPTSFSTRSVQIEVDCGDTPVVSIVGGGEVLHMGEGVDTTLSIVGTSSTGFTLTSDLRTTDAAPGLHQAATILLVTPQ